MIDVEGVLPVLAAVVFAITVALLIMAWADPGRNLFGFLVRNRARARGNKFGLSRWTAREALSLKSLSPLSSGGLPWHGKPTEGLSESLDRLATILESGVSLQRAMLVVAEESDKRLAQLFTATWESMAVGMPLSRAVERAGSIFDSPDVALLVTAIAVNARVGGSLAPVVRRCARSLRARRRLAAELRAETTQVRISANIVGFMPLLLIVVLLAINPGYLSPLFATTPGRTALATALAADVAGFWITRSIVARARSIYG